MVQILIRFEGWSPRAHSGPALMIIINNSLRRKAPIVREGLTPWKPLSVLVLVECLPL